MEVIFPEYLIQNDRDFGNVPKKQDIARQNRTKVRCSPGGSDKVAVQNRPVL